MKLILPVAFTALVILSAARLVGADDGAAPEAFSCADEFSLNQTLDLDRATRRVREVEPRSDGERAPELYEQARHAGLAYALYDLFDAGEDPLAAFDATDLRPVALIYGRPGRGTERRRNQERTRTLYGFVADHPASDTRYVVFRGTQTPAEWVRNLQFDQRRFPSDARRWGVRERVHRGFLEIFDSLQLESVAPEGGFAGGLSEIATDGETVFVGHSLGAALATLAAVDLAQRDRSASGRVSLVTLASPRVGNAAFAELAESLIRIDRVCNLVDAVPAVPLSTRRLDYVHVGALHAVSSFDWPWLANDLESAGEQIGCWHGHNAYNAMLSAAHAEREPAACFR